MKKHHRPSFSKKIARFYFLLLSTPFAFSYVHAADIVKADNSTALDDPASWVGGVVPGENDVAVFNSTLTSSVNPAVNNNVAFKGIRVQGNPGNITLAGLIARTATIGSAGFDLSAATSGTFVDIDSPTVVLRPGSGQVWSAASGVLSTIWGGFTTTGAAAIFDSTSGKSGEFFAEGFGTPGMFMPTVLTRTDAALNFATIRDGDRKLIPADALAVANPSDGGVSTTAAVLTGFPAGGYVDVINSNGLASATAFTINGSLFPSGTSTGSGIRFNQPHATPGTTWTVGFGNAGRIQTSVPVAILVTPAVGASDVIFGNGTATHEFRFDRAGGQLIFHQNNPSGNVIWRGDISSATNTPNATTSTLSSVIKHGPGKLILANGGYGPTVAPVYISEGMLQLGENNATGNLNSVPIVNNGTLRFQRSDTVTYANLISGSGNVEVAMSGTGNLTLSGANTFTGTTKVQSGTLTLGSAGALGATPSLELSGGSLAFGAGVTTDISSATIAINANTTLNTGANDVTLANSIGAAGTGMLTKTGSGNLTLGGANTYTGGTVISAGGLRVTNTSGSATGVGSVTLATGTTLGGTGTISGAVSTAAGTKIMPGTDGVGTLTAGALSLAASSLLDLEFSSTSSYDKVVVGGSNGLTINGGGISLYQAGSATSWNTPGTYNLFQYNGSVQGAGPGALSVLNPQAGYAYTFGASGGFVTLLIELDAILSEWSGTGSGSWGSTSNWGNGVPTSGYTAQFTTALGAPATVTLDGNRTVNGMVFSSENGYTIAQGTGGTLTFDKGVKNAAVNVTLGDHVISAPVALVSTIAVGTEPNTSLTISGVVSGAGGIIKNGAGTLDLTGHNTFTGAINATAGVLGFAHSDSLGTGAITLNGATLRYDTGNTADISSRSITFAQDGATVDTNGNDVIWLNPVGNGGTGSFTKAGAGILSLGSASAYPGNTIVTGGVLQIDANDRIGEPSANLILNGGTLATSASFNLQDVGTTTVDRPVVVGSGGGAINVASDTTFGLTGVLSGAGALTKSGAGTLRLPSTTATNTGGVILSAGLTNIASNVNFGNSTAVLGTGAITFAGGTLTHSYAAANTLEYTNAIAVQANTSSTFITPNRFRLNSAFSGAGTLDMPINTNVSRADFQNNFAGFTGNLNLTGTGVVRLGLQALASNQPTFAGAGWAATTLSLDGVTVTPTTNSGGNTITIGALKSSGSTGVLGGGTAGAPNYTIGGKTVGGVFLDTTFGGSFTGNAIVTKAGDGRLTLTGSNNVTSGAINVNGGTLDVRGTFAAFYRSSGADGIAGNTDDYSSTTEPTDGQPWTLVQPGAVTVAAAGTLAGTGNLGGAITVNGGLRPDSTGLLGGQLTVVGSGSLNLAATAATQFDFGGAQFTGVKSTSTGSVTYGGALKLNFLGTVFSGSYQLFQLAVAPTGAFTGVSVTTTVDAETALTDSGSGVWSGTVGAQSYSFDAATGTLTVTGGASAVTPGASTLSATAGNAKVDLSWTSASGADSYTVKRATVAGGPYTNVVSNLAGTTYSDTGLTNDTTYYYVVQARNSSSGLFGANSNEVSATPAAAPVHTALENWRFEKFGVYADTAEVLAGDTEDFDGDGLANLLEYAIDTDPTVPNASPLVVSRSGDFLTLTYPRRATADAALTYAVLGSSNLTTGFSAGTGSTNTVGATSTYTDDVSVATAGARRFLRLSVSYTAP